jgi:hypothetical protein
MRTCRQTRAPASHLHRGGRVCGEGPAVRVLTRRHNAARACGLGSAPTPSPENSHSIAQYRTAPHGQLDAAPCYSQSSRAAAQVSGGSSSAATAPRGERGQGGEASGRP